MSEKSYSEMNKQELDETLLSLTKEQFSLRMQKSTSGSIKPHLIKNVRKNIARVKMYLGRCVKVGE